MEVFTGAYGNYSSLAEPDLDDLFNNKTNQLLGMHSLNGSGGGEQLPESEDTFTLQRILRNVVTPIICAIGIVGNIMNLVVLTHIRLRKADGAKDNGSHLGLIMMAVSDVLFCLAVFPRGFVPESASLFTSFDAKLLYQVYGTGLVTTFILTSTWLTVAMAMLRYIGICHPFMAKKIDCHLVSKILYFSVFLLGVLFNIPTFFQYKITNFTMDGQQFYLVDIGLMAQRKTFEKAFTISKAVLGIFIPTALLVFFNCSLIKALKESHHMRRQCHVQETTSRTSIRITLTLIVIIIAFFLLVIPCEVMDFFSDFIRMDARRTEHFLFWRSIGNICQIVNFSFNFILYFAINCHFRSVLRDLVVCSGKLSNGSGVSYSHRMLRQTSTFNSDIPMCTPSSTSQHTILQRLDSVVTYK